ncbi:hypothetical protein GCM10009007_09330 [Formosimonas limnophila]|uniref:Thermostable hemolysin n=1 Tax=Formosimonas limnophila TaxID=1384487 RepID=A0A8J3G0I9_9BURK|nr:thermostable hemolysin [Formosimonas limnophila]GHA70659.1 hypothetical protein GCM10009007_09330 [Formosimonas limnophila]
MPYIQTHYQEEDSALALKKVIQLAYRHYYRARVTDFMPMLAQVFVKNGTQPGRRLIATCGLRSADEILLLEQYLPAPIEKCISENEKTAVERKKILEVGQLVMQDAKEIKTLFRMMTEYCKEHHFDYMVFTVVRVLKTHLDRYCVPTRELARADISQVKQPEQWGHYYRHEPVVLYVNVASAYDVLHENELIRHCG